jgi:hypothetical protein
MVNSLSDCCPKDAHPRQFRPQFPLACPARLPGPLFDQAVAPLAIQVTAVSRVQGVDKPRVAAKLLALTDRKFQGESRNPIAAAVE